MAKFEGNRGLVLSTSNGTPMVAEVTIVDSKRAFGRIDVLVKGKRGVFMVPAWVDSSKLINTADEAEVRAALGFIDTEAEEVTV